MGVYVLNALIVNVVVYAVAVVYAHSLAHPPPKDMDTF